MDREELLLLSCFFFLIAGCATARSRHIPPIPPSSLLLAFPLFYSFSLYSLHPWVLKSSNPSIECEAISHLLKCVLPTPHPRRPRTLRRLSYTPPRTSYITISPTKPASLLSFDNGCVFSTQFPVTLIVFTLTQNKTQSTHSWPQIVFRLLVIHSISLLRIASFGC
ncbi:hypothetical protein B0T10DRAFT_246396 [Thelonectria olida]|uniref:Uncharacterized protein n=1 Tax=Thelonectria olida TaxID=1576542 RepID=A0A9P8WCP1_9HYPO|nr:hypothetical protein B0T10DRAFT_246396 [Thelonectria olida]